jgi:hypothetical protein
MRMNSSNFHKLVKIVKNLYYLEQSQLVVDNAKYISSSHDNNTSVLHRQKKASINVDDVRYLEYMETPEKYREFLN